MLSYQNDHDYARAKAITAKIDNEEWRRNILGAIAAHAAVGVAREGRYDEALRIAEDVAALEQRAQVYTQMAFAAIDARDQQRGREILDAAEKLMPKGTATMSAELAAALVWLANSYVRLDKQRGFEVMQTAIDALNKVDLAEASTDAIKFGSSSVPIRRFDTGPGFEGLAKTDYFRSLLMAQSLKHRELAIAAQLAVIRGVLSMEPLPPEKTETPKKKETKATARPRTRQLVKPLSIPEEPANPPSAAPADDPDTRRLPDSGRKPATEGDPER
jgi:tetratricopeptide (TPR) repeat protein